MVSKGQRCPQCGNVKKRVYCLPCKAARERNRYLRFAPRERARKRAEYARKKDLPVRTYARGVIYGELMNATTCEHLLAEQVPPEQIAAELPGTPTDAIIFACFECGNYLNDAGEIVTAESGESHAPKASAPKPGRNRNAPAANEEKRAYRRDPSKKVTVRCKHPLCSNTWKVWPQNAEQAEYCPQKHKPLHKMAQGRERQRRFRQQSPMP